MKAIKKIMVAVLLSLSMVVSFMPTNVFAAEVPTFSGGNGTQEDPWLISSSNDLIELADWVNSEKAKTFDMDDCGTGYFHGYYFKQISNIDLTGVDYAPIGYTDTDEIYFSGNYDGNNFIISNITSTGKQDSDGQTTVGIFGFIVEAKIENIHVKNADFLAIGNNSYAHAGGIVGVAYDSSIKNCFVENSTIESKRNPSQNNCAGGIAGYCAGGTFEKCISNNNIINSQCYGGGFVGEIDDDYPGLGESSFEDCAVVNCKVTTAAENTRNYSFSGGFVGEVNSDGVNVKNSFVYKTNIFAHDNGDLTNAGVFAGNLYENSYADYYSKLITMNCYYGECGSVSDNTFTASSKSKEEFENGIVAGLLGDSFVQNGSSITLKTYPADYTKVNEAKAKVPSDLSIYTDESVNALKDALALVEDGKNITEQATVDGYADAINKAIDQLEYKAADYTEVDKAIEKANKLNKDNYEDFSKVEDAIKTVVRSKNITEQDEVDAMAKAINDAIDALVFQLKIKYGSNGGTGTMANPTVELDKEFTFPKCEYVAPNEKHFKGWQVDNTVYKVGDKRVFTKDDQNKEIKAVWEEHTFDQKLKEVNGVSTLKDKATCTTNAIYYKSCACGQVSTTETFEDKDTKLGHEYTKQIKDSKYLKSQGSHCQEHDVYWYACSRCDVSAKDDENAQDKYYESAEVGNHVFSKDWHKDSNNHWHSCTVPGCNEVSDKGNHVYNQEVESSEYLATPATCMTPARYYKSCICGAKGTEAFAATGTHLGHAYIEVKNPQFLREKATNCKEHDTYWYVCSRCGKTSKTINKYYEDKDSKGEHISSDWIIDQQPTVAKEGSKHKECTVCKEVLETEKIAKLENVKTETKKEETASKKEIKVESKKAVTTGDNTNSIVPIVLLGISLLGIYMIVMKKYVR